MVTETIVNEVNIDVRPRVAYRNNGVQNIRLYSDILLEEWEREIDTAKSNGGIVIASLTAYWMGEFSNSFILAKMKLLTSGRWLWTRTIGSTLVGELVDTMVFVAVASAFQVFPWSLFVTLTITNYIFKVGVEVVMTPLTYAVVRALKRAEHEDFYDRETNFSPFAIS